MLCLLVGTVRINDCDFSEIRTSHRRCSIEKVALKKFTKFIGKHLCQSLFFNKVAGLRHRCFPVDFANFLRTPYLQKTSGRLLLKNGFIVFSVYKQNYVSIT